MRIGAIPQARPPHSVRKCLIIPALAAAALLGLSSPGHALAQALVVNAAYTTGITIDGDPSDWTNLPSGVITMDTKGRGAGYGTLAVDIQYAWDYTNLYILVKENTNYAVALLWRKRSMRPITRIIRGRWTRLVFGWTSTTTRARPMAAERSWLRTTRIFNLGSGSAR